MAFGVFEVHAGDFAKGKDSQFVGTTLTMKNTGKFFREDIPASKIAELTPASEESVKKLGGTVGWGIVGGALLGPVGLLAGLLAGGRGKEVTFICVLEDGRKFMATAPSKVYTALAAAVFR